MAKYLLLIMLIAISLNGCSRKSRPAPVSDQSPYPQTQITQTKTSQLTYNTAEQHQVKKGETLYSIGFKYEIDYKTLAQINHIEQPYRIYPGQIIKLKTQTHTNSQPIKQTNTQVSTQAIRIEPTITATETTLPETTTKTTPPETATPKIVSAKAEPTSSVKPQTPPSTTTVSQQQTEPTPAKPTTQAKQPTVKPTPTQAETTAEPLNKQPKQLLKKGKLNWLWPTKGKVLSTFKANVPSRRGISIGGQEGQSVKAAEGGTVVYSGNGMPGYGELIIIKHNEQYLSAYGHNKQRLVKEGQNISRGQKIALLGSSGTNIDNLQFEIFKNGKPINPLPLIK